MTATWRWRAKTWGVVVGLAAVVCLGRWWMGGWEEPGQAPPVETAATVEPPLLQVVYCAAGDHIELPSLEERAQALRDEITALRPIPGERHDDHLRRAADYLARVAELHLDVIEANPGMTWWSTSGLDRAAAVDAAVSLLIEATPPTTSGEGLTR